MPVNVGTGANTGDGDPLRSAFIKVNDGLSSLANNIGKIFPSRQAAVDATQAAIPAAYSRIITMESDALVFRSPGNNTDDPLFGTSPFWGVVTRVDLAAEVAARIDGDEVNANAIKRTNLKTGQAYPMPPGLGISDAIAALSDNGDVFVVTALKGDAGVIENGRIEERKVAMPPGLGVRNASISEEFEVISSDVANDGAWFASEDDNGTRQVVWNEGDVSRQVTYGPENKQPLDKDGTMVRATVAGQPARGHARRIGPAPVDDDVVRLVIVYGQSLALGHNGATTQYSAWWDTTALSSVLMLSSGLSPLQDNHNATLVEGALGTLVTAQGASSVPPQNNNDVAALPLALAVQEQCGGLVVAVALGKGGTPIADLSKGTTPYNNVLTWVSRATDQVGVDYPTKTVRVEVISFCHGEADPGLSVAAYAAARDQLFADFAADIALITGQVTGPVNMVGQTAATAAGGEVRPSAYAAGDGVNVCYGPQYSLGPYVDGAHLEPRGYSDLGVQMGLAYQGRVHDQRLRPISAFLHGDEIVVTFSVPKGQLIVDPSVTDDGTLGLNYRDSTSSAHVVSARIINETDVLLKLSAVPSGSIKTIGVADRGSGNPGRNSGARSPLCDQSNRFNFITGGWMPNRAIVAEIPVT